MGNAKTSSKEQPIEILGWEIQGDKVIFNSEIEGDELKIIYSSEGVAAQKEKILKRFDDEKKEELRALNAESDALVKKYETELKARLGAITSVLPDIQGPLDKKLERLNFKNEVTDAQRIGAEQKAKDRGYVAIGAAVIMGLAGAFATVINGNNQHSAGEKSGEKKGFLDGEKKGFLDGEKKGLSQGYIFGFENGSINASLTQDLESKILGGEGKWNVSQAYDAGKKLFNSSDLHNMTFDQMVSVYGLLNFNAGVYSTPAAKNLTDMLKGTLNQTYEISNESLKNITDPVSALNLFKAIAQFEVYAAAANWNDTAKEQGRKEILALAQQWGTQNYTAGQDNILNQTPAWGLENFTAGQASIKALAEIWNATHFGDGANKSLAEVIAVVDDVLTQGQINDAGSNVTKLLDVYKQKLVADAYEAGLQNLRMVQWMNGVTVKELTDPKLSPSEKNDTLALWMQNIDMFPETVKQHGWSYMTLNESNLNQTTMEALLKNSNISNDTKDYIRKAVNSGRFVKYFNLTNYANDAANGSLAQGYNTQTRSIADDGEVTSDADYSETLATVKGG